MEHKVAVFFYGSYINLNVLKEVDIIPDNYEIARLKGFDISINPHANIHKCKGSTVYGIITHATHEELERLYIDHAKGVLKETYKPEAVLVRTANGNSVPALCYISRSMKEGEVDEAYIDRIVRPAKKYGFPADYVSKLESFRKAKQPA